MKPVLAFFTLCFALTLITGRGLAQDVALRQQAAELLSRANRSSASPRLPNLERVDTFRVLDASSGPTEGSFSRVVIQGTGRRDEFTFGDYHAINVWNANGLATVRSQEVAPPEIANLMRLTPSIPFTSIMKRVARTDDLTVRGSFRGPQPSRRAE